MKLGAQLILADTVRKTARLRKRTPIVTAQELNRQRKRSRTLLARRLKPVSGVQGGNGGSTALRRIRKRILLPNAARANKRRLAAGALALFEIYPMRYFRKRARGRNARTHVVLPPGAVVRESARPGTAPYVDISAIAYRVRETVLDTLAKDWPKRWEKRMRYEIQKAFA